MSVFHRLTSIAAESGVPTAIQIAARLAALEAAQADADAMNIEHEYRLTLLELGVGEEG